MKDILLIENDNNLNIINHDIAFTSNVSIYVSQKIRIKLSFFLAEWYLNKNIGLPYFEQIFIKNPDINFIEDLYKIKISEIPEVKELTNLTLEFEERELLVTFSLITIEDESITSSFSVGV